MAKPKSKKRRRLVIFSILLLIVIGGVSTAFLRKREVLINVQTELVARRNITETVIANGKIQPVMQVKISPEVSGEIIELPVKEGQHVNKGDLLLRIKPDLYIANKRSVEASYQGALSSRALSEANLRKAESEFRRTEGLYRDNLVSESVFIEVKTAFEIATASLDQSKHHVGVSKAALDRSEEELSKTTIFSPITGNVSRLNSELGERVVGTAMMTGTEVMTVADLNVMEARVDVGEMDVVLIKPGQTARLEVDAFRDRKFGGVVTEIANSSKGMDNRGGGSGGQQEATRFEVRIRVTEKEAFRPGMSVTAEIETRTRTNVLTVPIQSVTTRMPKSPKPAAGTNSAPTNVTATASASEKLPKKDGKKADTAPKPAEVVFVCEGDTVKMAKVKRGISDDSYTEIEEGVTEGQSIVSGGYKAISRDLDDGKKVKKGSEPVAPKK